MGETHESGAGRLGFGYMRLPLKDGKFDVDSVNAMVDRFLEQGFYYFDTAYVYEGSEEALRESLVKRHPRDRFWITTKLPIIGLKDPAAQEKRLQTSLRRLGVDYVDSYYIHAMDGKNAETAEQLGSWEFLRSVKARGLARHIGFSFHGTPEVLDELLIKHPEIEFVQLQLNYLDWESPAVRAREQYEIARRHGKKITVMEPCKGGFLASGESEAAKLFRSQNPAVSAASWAFRFVLGLEGIAAILSGMGDMEQLEDNARTFKEYVPLTKAEHKTIEQAVELINSIPRIPCTSCRYCTPHCPKKIEIPQFIFLYNNLLVHNDKNTTGYIYGMITGTKSKVPEPKDCVKCRECEARCPQHIEISDVMEKTALEIAGARDKFFTTAK